MQMILVTLKYWSGNFLGSTPLKMMVVVPPHSAEMHSTEWHSKWQLAELSATVGNPYWRGRFDTADLQVKIACLVKKRKYIFIVPSSLTELVSTSISIVLILPHKSTIPVHCHFAECHLAFGWMSFGWVYYCQCDFHLIIILLSAFLLSCHSVERKSAVSFN